MSSGRIQLELVGTGSIQTALGDRRKFRVVTFPAGPRGKDGLVTSVAGRTGAVVLTKADVGLGNVDNTTDAAKPVSTAQAAADASVASAAAADATAKAAAALASANAAAPGLAPVQSVAGRTGAVVLALADLTDSTPAGRALAAALDATAQRVLLGLGNSATRNVGTAAGTVAAGDDARLSDARTPTSHTHTASEISDSTSPGRTLLTAADAAAQRTALGLGTAAVRADSDFPRFDADQSPTAAQKRTARYNLGLADSFTCAELLALSTTDSARLRFAFCSDCFSSGATTSHLVGDMCLWVGDRWVTYSDRVTPRADPDFPQWALEIARIRTELPQGPFLTMFGESANANGLGFPQYASGTGASNLSPVADGQRLARFSATPGTTSSGVFRGLPTFAYNNTTSDIQRKAAVVLSWFGSSEAVSSPGVDEWHWRVGLQNVQFSATASLQIDDVGFVVDDRNTLGQGASGANLRAMCRLGSTTTHFVDTGISATTGSAFLIVTWEPTGPASTRGRVRLCSAGDFGGAFTTHVDLTSTAAGSILQPVLCGAKTLGTGNRFVSRRWLRFVTLRTSVGSGGIIS